jgi:hypothetical protein
MIRRDAPTKTQDLRPKTFLIIRGAGFIGLTQKVVELLPTGACGLSGLRPKDWRTPCSRTRSSRDWALDPCAPGRRP